MKNYLSIVEAIFCELGFQVNEIQGKNNLIMMQCNKMALVSATFDRV